VISGVAFALAGIAVIWSVIRFANADPPQIKAVPHFSNESPPTWEDVSEYLKAKFPDLDPKMMQDVYNRSRDLALARGVRDYAARVEKGLFPEVTLIKRSDSNGYLQGRVHNETQRTIEKLKLLIKTSRWERVYEVTVFVENNATATFSLFVADRHLEVECFRVLAR